MKRLAFSAVLLMGVLAPRAAFSQEDAPERRTSLSLRPFGETTVGVWHRFSPRVELGLEIGASTSQYESETEGSEQSAQGYMIEPAAKLYGSSGGDLRPYGFGGVSFSSQRQEYSNDAEAVSTSLGAVLGMGVEWSPVARVRIGGHAGVRAAILGGERPEFDPVTGAPAQVDVEGWDAGTFTSGLTFYYSF